MFQLTSVARAKASLGVSDSKEDGLMAQLVASASLRVASWLRRADSLELKERVAIVSPFLDQRKFYLPAYPITSVASVKYDSTGLFTGSETTVTGFFVVEGRAVVLPIGIPFVAPNSVKITYTGGLAASATVSVWAKSADAGGTLTVGKYIQGATSGAIGRITAVSSGSVSYENLAGVFVAEGITEYATYDAKLQGAGLSTTTGVTSTLTSATSVCLAEIAPDLVAAVEAQIRYKRSSRFNSEKTTTGNENDTNLSPTSLAVDVFSIPQVRDDLKPYKNTLVE